MRLLKSLILLILFISAISCGDLAVGTDPFHDHYYDKEKLLMTEEELEIYNHLPDKESKEEFVKEFWLKRDPTPATERNELKEEFDKRVEFANRWFDEKGDGKSGWDTDRGRVLLVFGNPDRRDQRQVQLRTRFGTAYIEVWIYDRHQLMLRFIDEMGYKVFRLTSESQYALMTAMRQEKLLWGARQAEDGGFQFKVAYKNGGFNFIVPLTELQVGHQGDNVVVTFIVNVTAYLKYKKINGFTKEHVITHNQDKFLELKNISFDIPYPLVEKGRYHFDIVVENKLSSQKYRKLLKVKI